MARNIENIQHDIERNHNRLARTLDELAVRTNPKSVVDGARTRVFNTPNKPKVQAALDIVAALVVGGIAVGIRRNCNRNKEIDRIREMTGTAVKRFFGI